MKYGFIDANRRQFPVAALCRALKVSRSGFHAWRSRPQSKRAQADSELLREIRRIHLEHREVYGAVKTWQTLARQRIACGKHRVARLRREAGIEARRVVRQRTTIAHYKTAAPAPDRLQQCFAAALPNQVWAGDMTFVRTREGWLHLAVLLDLFSRKVVGWAMDHRPGQELHTGALEMAIQQRRPARGLIHHTDRGIQYRTVAYRSFLERHGILASMNARKVPQDNAVAESFFSTLKNELIHHCDFATRAQARSAIFEFIEVFYNRRRIHQSLGYRTPEQVEQEWSNGA